MKKSKIANFALLVGTLSVSIIFCSWILDKLQPAGQSSHTAIKLIKSHPSYQSYTSEEADLNKPLYTDAQGQKCVNVIRASGMHYSPYFGWNTQVLDKGCAKQHFSQPGTKVVFFGGSAMENFEAPNYLTKIDNYVNKQIPDLISLNLAESGGRSTNTLVRIMLEAIDLSADYWVFLDGYNEFNSLKYNGKYDEDFYWTATINDRIHRPLKSMFDRLIAKSRLAEKLFYETGLVDSPRKKPTQITHADIIKAADLYIENIRKTSMVCEAKKIKCLFFLQPYSNTNSYILDTGYAHIIEQIGDKVIDLRPIFAGQSDAFVDEVHFNKTGSKLVADAIAHHIIQSSLPKL